MGPVSITMFLVGVGLLLTVVSAVTIQDKAVTPHWENICGTSLLFSEDAKTWDDARGTCELFGGNLVDIRSMEMNYCILDHAYHKALPQTWYWTSGNDIDVEVYIAITDMVTSSPGLPSGIKPMIRMEENPRTVSLSHCQLIHMRGSGHIMDAIALSVISVSANSDVERIQTNIPSHGGYTDWELA